MEKAKYIKAHYEDDEVLLKGIKQLKDRGLKILDVLTPFPVHGLDKALGYRRSYIARVGFIGGAIGCILAFIFQAWVFTVDYPLNIGGKPYFSVPTFIPITFELTVLGAAISMVFAFLFRSKIGPGADTYIHDERSTDDRFVVLIGVDEEAQDEHIDHMIEDIEKTEAKDITVKSDVEVTKNY